MAKLEWRGGTFFPEKLLRFLPTVALYSVVVFRGNMEQHLGRKKTLLASCKPYDKSDKNFASVLGESFSFEGGKGFQLERNTFSLRRRSSKSFQGI